MRIILRIPRRGLPRAGLTAGAVAVVAVATLAARGAPPAADATVEPAMQEAANPSLAAAPRDAFMLAPAVGENGPTAVAGEPGQDGSAPVPPSGLRPGGDPPAQGGAPRPGGEEAVQGQLAGRQASPSSARQQQRESQQPEQRESLESQEPQQQQQQEGAAPPPQQQGGVGPVMTAEEEVAMRLIRQILEQEEGVRMGRDFAYDPQGRRDPFRSLLQQAASQVAVPQVRPPGLPGFLVSEVEVKAIARYQAGWAALLLAPDQNAYFAEVGSELYDGHIKQIRSNEVVFEQRVSDLLGARRTREVVKRLRDIGGGSESRP